MQGLSLEIGACIIPFIVGVVIGTAAFGVLMLALLPVLKGRRRPRLSWGFAAIMASFALLAAGIIGAYLLLASALLWLLAGELAGLFVCWAVLAWSILTHRWGPNGTEGKGRVV